MHIRVCAHTECGKEFEPKTHNMRYCSDECCRLATNKRIMEKYYERKERRKGGRRVCQTPFCNTVLNRYNDLEICGVCSARKTSSGINYIRDMVLGGVR